jgi:hypothetical protein
VHTLKRATPTQVEAARFARTVEALVLFAELPVEDRGVVL